MGEGGTGGGGGGAVVRVWNLEVEWAGAQAVADMTNASARATQASMSYTNFGLAEHERQQSTERHRSFTEEMKHLEVTSPIKVTVTTLRLHDLMGAYLKPGTNVAEVADLSTMTARIYVPEFGMRDVNPGAPVRLHAASQFTGWSGILLSLAPASSSIENGLVEKAQLEGIRAPKFYIGNVELQNRGDLRDGMSGD